MIPIRDSIPARRIPFVTSLLIGVNLAVFLHQWWLPPRALEALVFDWGIIPLRVLHAPLAHEWPTFLSYMFLHGGWLHVIANMWALWLFGDNVEDRLGHGRFVLFYVLCGIAAAAVHVKLNPASQLPTIGASGAIAGVMGAYFLYYPHSRMMVLVPIFFYPLFIEIPSAVYLLLWVLLQLFSGTFSILANAADAGGVAFWAHVGGFAAGMLMAIIWR